jgi:hypothetical protein
MVLNAYIDASGKGDPKHLVMAGYIAAAEVWTEFSKAWQERLDQAGLPYFKMNMMSSRPEIAGWFYRLVEEQNIKAAISCVIRTDELIIVENSIRYPRYIVDTNILKNPYWFAFKAIIDVLAQHQKQLGITDPVNFVFDDDSEKVKIPQAWELMKNASSPEIASLMGELPIYRDDTKVLPLQAADLYAWWILKWEREGIVEWGRTLPFPWGIKKNILRLTMSFRKRDFLIESSRTLAKFARTPDEFSYAMSLLPSAEQS